MFRNFFKMLDLHLFVIKMVFFLHLILKMLDLWKEFTPYLYDSIYIIEIITPSWGIKELDIT